MLFLLEMERGKSCDGGNSGLGMMEVRFGNG
jgi:hypothetical protein